MTCKIGQLLKKHHRLEATMEKAINDDEYTGHLNECPTKANESKMYFLAD